MLASKHPFPETVMPRIPDPDFPAIDESGRPDLGPRPGASPDAGDW